MQKSLSYIFLIMLTAITAAASDYQCTDAGMRFLWQFPDYVGIYTAGGTVVMYYPSSINGSYATMQSGFGLSENTIYYAYSPYNKEYWNKPMTTLPVSFLHQSQRGNNNTTHLSAYDYQMSTFTTGTASSAAVSFRHVGAVINIRWVMPASINGKSSTLTPTAISLTSGAYASKGTTVFTDSATMNLTTHAITAITKNGSVILALSDISLSADDTLSAYLMVPPADLTGDTLTATLHTNSGAALTAHVSGTNVLAGYLYPISIGLDETIIPASAKTVAPASSITTIPSVVAFSPDFAIDNRNAFKPISLYPRGDVNRDKKVNGRDTRAILSVICGEQGYETHADVNDDGAVDVRDVNTVIDIITGN